MSKTPTQILRLWLQQQLPTTAWRWLEAELAKLASDPSDRQLHITLGLIPRQLGKADLSLSADDLDAAQQARSGWQPQFWSVDSAARVLVMCCLGSSNFPFAERFTELCRYTDVAEQIALYRGLPLYPEPEQLETQAAEGLRTNMRAVFEAVAHHNPYPQEQFGQNRWNQMVLKALFVDSQLWPIQGLDQRANPELARILCDYAHERWAAGRSVAVELWRCVGPFAEGAMLDDLERVLKTGSDNERTAAVLALAASPDPRSDKLLTTVSELAAATTGALDWDRFSQTLD